MSYFSALVYDRIIKTAEESFLGSWRHELLKTVTGDVLEIGAGTGLNVDYYPETVSRLVLSEPDMHMRKRLEKRIANATFSVSVTTDSAERIDASDETFDYVVTSLVCCTVRNLDDAMLEIKRVLRPEGRLIFMEHVAAPVGSRQRWWQNAVNPFWRRVSGNCHLNRDIEKAIVAAGFEMHDIKREIMPKVMPLFSPTIRGIAMKCG